MRRSVSLATAVLLLTLLAGCGGGKVTPPPVSKSPSPTSSVSPTVAAAPVMPDAAKERTKAGAIAFVKYYFDAQGWAQLNLDTTGLAQLTQPSCQSCKSAADFIDRMKRRGGFVHAKSPMLIVSECVAKSSGALIYAVRCKIRQRALVSKLSRDSAERHFKATTELISIDVRRSEDRWLIHEYVGL